MPDPLFTLSSFFLFSSSREAQHRHRELLHRLKSSEEASEAKRGPFGGWVLKASWPFLARAPEEASAPPGPQRKAKARAVKKAR